MPRILVQSLTYDDGNVVMPRGYTEFIDPLVRDEQTQILLALDGVLARDALPVFQTLSYDVAREAYSELCERFPDARWHFAIEDVNRTDN